MFGRIVAAFLLIVCSISTALAQDATWRVSKTSGEVSLSSSGTQPVALTNDSALKPGDTIRTGQDGRALLTRGAETMLISANSVVGIPPANKDGMETTILQQAGSILLDVEKRNVQHFEVATPYLAAVVKGTQFRVTVGSDGSHVEVFRGQVQVTDYKTGQYALVDPDQVARVSNQASGLSLTGSGILNPIQQGAPHSPFVFPLQALNGGDAASGHAQNEQPVRMPALAHGRTAPSWNEPSADDGWASGMVAWAKNILGLSGRKSRDDDTTVFLAIPMFFGFSVAVGTAAIRRIRKRRRR